MSPSSADALRGKHLMMSFKVIASRNKLAFSYSNATLAGLAALRPQFLASLASHCSLEMFLLNCCKQYARHAQVYLLAILVLVLLARGLFPMHGMALPLCRLPARPSAWESDPSKQTGRCLPARSSFKYTGIVNASRRDNSGLSNAMSQANEFLIASAAVAYWIVCSTKR